MAGFAGHVVREQVRTPLEWRDKYALRRGAVFGLSHNLAQLSLLRPARKVQSVLEAAKAADVLLLLIPSTGLDTLGEHLIDAVCMQGVGTVVGVLQGIGNS